MEIWGILHGQMGCGMADAAPRFSSLGKRICRGQARKGQGKGQSPTRSGHAPTFISQELGGGARSPACGARSQDRKGIRPIITPIDRGAKTLPAPSHGPASQRPPRTGASRSQPCSCRTLATSLRSINLCVCWDGKSQTRGTTTRLLLQAADDGDARLQLARDRTLRHVCTRPLLGSLALSALGTSDAASAVGRPVLTSSPLDISSRPFSAQAPAALLERPDRLHGRSQSSGWV